MSFPRRQGANGELSASFAIGQFRTEQFLEPMAKREKPERLPRQTSGRGFRIRGEEFYGLPAYVIDCLLETGLYGTTREQVVTELAERQIRTDLSDLLKAMGGSVKDAQANVHAGKF